MLLSSRARNTLTLSLTKYAIRVENAPNGENRALFTQEITANSQRGDWRQTMLYP